MVVRFPSSGSASSRIPEYDNTNIIIYSISLQSGRMLDHFRYTSQLYNHKITIKMAPCRFVL